MALGYPRAGGTQGLTCSAFEVMPLSKRSFWTKCAHGWGQYELAKDFECL